MFDEVQFGQAFGSDLASHHRARENAITSRRRASGVRNDVHQADRSAA
jgi:hypothetical protein